MPELPKEMDRGDDQPVTAKLTMATIDKPILKGLIEQRISSDELVELNEESLKKPRQIVERSFSEEEVPIFPVREYSSRSPC